MKKTFAFTKRHSQLGIRGYRKRKSFLKIRNYLIILAIIFSLILCNCDLLEKDNNQDEKIDRLTFKRPKKLTGGKDGWDPTIAVENSGDILVCWLRTHVSILDIHPTAYIHTRRSEDGGKNWGSTAEFASSIGGAAAPNLAVDDTGILYLTYHFDRDESYKGLYFTKSTDGGLNWKRVNMVGGPDYDRTDMVMDSDGNLYAVWKLDFYSGKNHIRFSCSTDGGSYWSISKKISGEPEYSHSPAIAADTYGNIYVLWHNKLTTGNWDVFITRSADKGTTFSQPVNISNNLGLSHKAAIAISNIGDIYVAWVYTHAGNQDIHFSRSTDQGATWSQPLLISKGSGSADLPDMAVDRMGNINVVWVNTSNGEKEIFFSSSEDMGENWSDSVMISDNAKEADGPDIAAGYSGAIYVVWHNDDQVFFTRNDI